MKKNVFMVAMCLLFSATLFSCNQYPSFPGYTRTDTGLYYKEITKGTGNQVNEGDIVTARLAYYINDSLLFTTYADPNPFYYPIQKSVFPGDLHEAFKMMHVGDSMSFMIKADSCYKKLFMGKDPMPAYCTPEAYLRWEVVVDDALAETAFIEKMQQEQAAMGQKANEEFKAYLNANGVKEDPQESGFVYVRTKKGKGPKPGYKQTVKVHYTGRLLDGTKFDSSLDRGEPIVFPLGVGAVIRGWDEGIALMQKGEKGILYIPYYLAYGPSQRGPIPAYANLVFEVELVDFE